MAKVSIIVPIYNLENHISRCIDSIVSQSFKDIEIILVDDGSTDLCGEICDKYAKVDKRIKVFHQKNMGLSGARNTGIENSSSKWFTIIDADDWYEPNAIEILYKNAEMYTSDIFIGSFFANQEGKERKDCFFNARELHFNDKLKKRILEASCINPTSISNSSCSTNVGVTWARMYRLDFVKNNNLSFIVGLKRTQDAIFNMYAFEKANRIDFLDIPIQHYRLWEGSVSKKYNADFHLSAIQIASELEVFLLKTNGDEIIRNAYYAKLVCLVIETVLVELVHKENKNRYKEKRRILRELCNNVMFKKAIKEVNYNMLTKGQGAAAKLLRIKLYDIILILYSIKARL